MIFSNSFTTISATVQIIPFLFIHVSSVQLQMTQFCDQMLQYSRCCLFLSSTFSFCSGHYGRTSSYLRATNQSILSFLHFNYSSQRPLSSRKILTVNSTISSTFKFLSTSFHFCLLCSCGRYSFIHLFQNKLAKNCACLH